MRLKLTISFIILITLLLLGRIYFLSIQSNEYYEKLSKKTILKDFIKSLQEELL